MVILYPKIMGCSAIRPQVIRDQPIWIEAVFLTGARDSAYQADAA
jgi:hypothetical protein